MSVKFIIMRMIILLNVNAVLYVLATLQNSRNVHVILLEKPLSALGEIDGFCLLYSTKLLFCVCVVVTLRACLLEKRVPLEDIGAPGVHRDR